MVRLLFIFIFFQLYSVISAQDSTVFKTKHLLSIETGYSKHWVHDDVISPLIYKGSQFPLCLNGVFITKKSVHRLYFYYDYLKLTSSITVKNPVESFYTNNYNLVFQYAYTRKLYDVDNWKLSIYAGAEIKSILNQRDHYYNNYTHYTSGELVSDLGLSLMAIKVFDGSKSNYLFFRYGMALFSFDALNYKYNANVFKELNSEAYKNTSGDLVKTNKLVTVNKYFELHTEISYIRFISKRMGVDVKYHLQYYKSEKFQNLLYVKYLTCQYLIGVIVRI